MHARVLHRERPVRVWSPVRFPVWVWALPVGVGRAAGAAPAGDAGRDLLLSVLLLSVLLLNRQAANAA